MRFGKLDYFCIPIPIQLINPDTMPSFDIVSKVDPQTLDNVIHAVRKEITNRFDFRDSHVLIELDPKELILHLETDSEMKMGQMTDMLISRSVRQGLDPLVFDQSKPGSASGKYWKKDIRIQSGIRQEDAKKIVKKIKDSGIRVQAAIMDEIIRVSGKKIDDLQEVIRECKAESFGIPLQFTNMKN